MIYFIKNKYWLFSTNRGIYKFYIFLYYLGKERNSRLAEPTRKEDRFLRKYLNNLNGLQLNDMWIGARYNWERNKWQWGYNGEDLTYQSFSQMSA